MIEPAPVAAIVGIDVRIDRPTARRLGWQGDVRAPIAATAPIDEIAAAALDASGIRRGNARLVTLPAANDIAASVSAAVTALASGACDLVAIVSRAGVDGRVPGDVDGTVVLLLTRADAASPVAVAPLALVRNVIARPPVPGAPHERFPMLAEACAHIGVSPRSVSLFDLHATTSHRAQEMLDTVEFAVSRGANAPPHCTLGPACGPVTGLEAALALAIHVNALHTHVLPALRDRPEPVTVRSPFGADQAPRPWIATSPRRSAIWTDSADGLSLVLLETAPETTTNGAAARPFESRSDLPEDAARPDAILVSDSTPAGLIAQLEAIGARAAASPTTAVRAIDVAGAAASPARYRAAIIARRGSDLAAKATRLVSAITGSGRDYYQTPDGLFYADSAQQPRGTAFMFPGQGSQYVGMFRQLCLDLPGVQAWFERLQDAMLDVDAFPPGLLIAPPRTGLDGAHRTELDRAMSGLGCGALLTMASSLALVERLQAAGVRPDAMVGYSNGENAAVVAATGTLTETSMFAFMNLIRLHDDNDAGHVRGVALAVNRAAPARVADVVGRAPHGELFLALDNCPEQVVLFGNPDAISVAADQLRASGATCLPLAFEQGHHTPLFAGRARQLRALYEDIRISDARVPLYSCATAARFPDDPVASRDLAAGQWSQCVRFTETIEQMYADGIRCFVEVGPGSTLTGFVRSTLRGRPHIAVPTNIPGRPDLDQLLHLLARLHVQGHPIDLHGLRTASRPATAATVPAPSLADRASAAPTAPAPPAPSPLLPRAATSTTSPTPLPATVPAAPIAASADASWLFAQHHLVMQEFLQSQQRAFQQLAGALASQGAAPAADPDATWPMLGDVIRHTADRFEAVRRLDRRSDLFLWHHGIGALPADRGRPGTSVPLLPFSLSLEMLVEAAARFAGWRGPRVTVEDIRASQWIILDRDIVTLRVEATWDDSAVSVRIFDEGGGRPVFQGRVRGDAAPLTPLAIAPTGVPMLDRESFTALLFHGPLFVSIDRLLAVDAHSIRVECVTPSDQGWFADGRRWTGLVPGGLLDAASQMVGAWLAENGLRDFGLFPFEWQRYVQLAPPPAAGSRVTLSGRMQAAGQLTTADIDLCDADGTLVARIEGLRGKAVAFPTPYHSIFFSLDHESRLSLADGDSRRYPPLPAELFRDRPDLWLRVLARQMLSDREWIAWTTLDEGERADWLRRRIVAKEVALDQLAARGIRLHARDLDSADAPDGSGVMTVTAAGQFNVTTRVADGPSGTTAAMVAVSADRPLGATH